MSDQRLLIAGMGNDLCQDDGFGIVVLRRLAETGVPDGVRLYEAGIAGIGMVQELMDGFGALVIIDAVDRADPPGTVTLLETLVPELASFSDEERRVMLADTHYVIPSRALVLCKALDVLPSSIYILGCQPASCDLGMGLTPAVEAAVPEAVRQLQELAERMIEGVANVPSHPA